MTNLTTIHRNEDGFTLVEMLVGLSISIVVLFATLQSLDVFTSNAAQQTRVTDANDQLRATMDRTVSDLRSASQILTAAPTELAYAVPTTSGYRIERLCVAADKTLYGSSTASATATAPTGACSGTKLASLKSGTATAFTYDGAASSATPLLVKNVGLTLSLDTSGGGHHGSSTLTASAARRSAGSLPITKDDVEPKCLNATTALLNLSATIPGVAGLNVTYTSTGNVTLGVAAGTSAVQIPLVAGVTTTIVATVTDALGVTNILQKDVQCD